MDEAVLQFTHALAAIPNDTTALGERGYAYLHAMRHDDARADFERALAGGAPNELRAQIYFNLGLLEEQTGNAEPARAAFARSNRLHKTSGGWFIPNLEQSQGEPRFDAKFDAIVEDEGSLVVIRQVSSAA